MIDFVSYLSLGGIFLLVFSILYCLRVIYLIVKVATLKEGKVELGKNGMLYLGLAVSYIVTYIFS